MDDDAAPHRRWLALGGDIGGTTTRIIIADGTGTVHGRGVAAGGNPVSHPATAAAAFGEALGQAVAGADAGRVRGAVIGLAGLSALRDPAVRAEFVQAWSSHIGDSCTPTYVSDLEVAFAAGTSEPDGAVLIAGTGAIAGEIRGHRLVATADGHGWLLGDEGSGFWLGREAVRATLHTIEDPRSAHGPLTRSVLRSLTGDDDVSDAGALRDQVINAVNTGPPVRLSELAPLVTAAHAAGDMVATELVDEAARRLAGTLEQVRGTGPVVLAGSLAARDSPVGARLRLLLAEGSAEEPVMARDGVAGAAWLALAAVDRSAATPETRTRLVSSSA